MIFVLLCFRFFIEGGGIGICNEKRVIFYWVMLIMYYWDPLMSLNLFLNFIHVLNDWGHRVRIEMENIVCTFIAFYILILFPIIVYYSIICF